MEKKKSSKFRLFKDKKEKLSWEAALLLLTAFIYIGLFGYSIFMYSMMWHNVDLSHNMMMVNSCENLNYQDTADGITMMPMANIYTRSIGAMNYWLALALFSMFAIPIYIYAALAVQKEIYELKNGKK